MEKAKQPTRPMAPKTAGPDDAAVHRLFLKTGAPPEMVYHAVQEVRELASRNIVVAINAHATETAAKLDAQTAATAAKFDAQTAVTAAKFDAQRAEIGTLRTMMIATMSLIGLLISLVGVLAGLGVYKQVFEPSLSTPIVAAPSAAVAGPEAATEATESVPPTPAVPPE